MLLVRTLRGEWEHECGVQDSNTAAYRLPLKVGLEQGKRKVRLAFVHDGKHE